LLFFFACRERIALLYLDSCSTSKGSQSHVIHWKESSAFLCIFDKFSSESKDLNYHMHFSNGFQTVASSSAWSTYNSQTVVWSPAVLKSLMWQSREAKLKCKGSWFILWEMDPAFLSFSCLGTFQCNLSCRRTTKLIIASLKFESIKKMGLSYQQRKATVDSKALMLNR
jgi:hypothetical protein